MEHYDRIPLSAITPSPYQPRKTFPEQMLKEMAATIEARGVLSPIRVRPKAEGAYELVFGECRWRASELAGVADIPALIVDLTDDQVIEEILIENLKRSDVPPLEEGEHYHDLLHKYGYTMETLQAKTGKSRSYLYSRMKLTALAPGVKKALHDGRLIPAIAELIGRIADHKLQERACKDVLGEGGWEAYDSAGAQPEMLSDAKAKDVMQPLSYRAAAQLLRRRYTLRLELAKFNPHDAGLTAAGACTSCPHRSGNQPELPGLPGVNGKADDLCLNPPCFEAKTKASWERDAKVARDSGITVIEGKDAKEIFDHNDAVAPSAPYVDPKAELPPNLAKPGSKATWGKLLGKLLPNVPFVVVQHPGGGSVELLERDAATKILREVGKIEKTSAPTSPKKVAAAAKSSGKDKKISPWDDAETSRDRAQLRQLREIEEAALKLVLNQVVDAAAADDPGKKELAWWRWIAQQVIVTNNSGDADLVAKRRGVATFDALIGQVEKARTVGAIRALIVEIFMCIDGTNAHTGASDRDAELRFDEGMRLFGGGTWDKALAAAKALDKPDDAATKTAKKK